MGNSYHMNKLLKGREHWNAWRIDNPLIQIDLSGEDLSKISLGIDKQSIIKQADREGISLDGAGYSFVRAEIIPSVPTVNFEGADLRGVKILSAIGCDFSNANLSKAQLINSDVSTANLSNANLNRANLTKANLRGCSLNGTSFIETIVSDCILDDTYVYGASVWGVQGLPSSQKSLNISGPNQARLTVDNIELAQFVYLLVRNKKIRDVISTLSTKSVLILGRFTEPRKKVLDTLSDQIRARNMLPIIFDWEPSKNRDLTETVQLLASLCRFVLADITDAKSIPQELSHIIPFFPSVPVLPIISTAQRPYAMFEHWLSYSSVLSEFRYDNIEHLLTNFDEQLMKPLESWERQNINGKSHSDMLEMENKQLRDELDRLQKNNSSNS